MQVTLEQAREIVNENDGNQNAQITSFSEIESTSYSSTASRKLFHIALTESDRSYLLSVSPLASSDTQPPTGPISLPALSLLLSKILDSTPVPVPRPVAHDVSSGGGKWRFGWLLLRIPGSPRAHTSMSLASVRHELSPRQLSRVELKLGTYLRALHGITNDCFGIPMDKITPEPPSLPSFTALFAAKQIGEDGEVDAYDTTPYSWQDTFVLRLEELLEKACGVQKRMVDVDVGELRRCLSRAIGSFLFDDVEMPRLVWVTGFEEDVIVSPGKCNEGCNGTPCQESTEADIAFILPTFGHALWGDPLMEAWFLPPGPTKAINEGYFDGQEDCTLILFPRQKTKRVWYTVYLALIVLAEEMSQKDGEAKNVSARETTQWARRILPECVEILKNAPCY